MIYFFSFCLYLVFRILSLKKTSGKFHFLFCIVQLHNKIIRIRSTRSLYVDKCISYNFRGLLFCCLDQSFFWFFCPHCEHNRVVETVRLIFVMYVIVWCSFLLLSPILNHFPNTCLSLRVLYCWWSLCVGNTSTHFTVSRPCFFFFSYLLCTKDTVDST